MTAKSDAYIKQVGLEATSDAQRPVFRRPGFDGVVSTQSMDGSIGNSVRESRIEKDLSRAEVALLLGTIEPVLGRYERADTKLHATQVLQLCELLQLFPDDLLFNAAPHLWGDTIEEAHERRRIAKMIERLPKDTLLTVATILDSILKLQGSSEP